MDDRHVQGRIPTREDDRRETVRGPTVNHKCPYRIRVYIEQSSPIRIPHFTVFAVTNFSLVLFHVAL